MVRVGRHIRKQSVHCLVIQNLLSQITLLNILANFATVQKNEYLSGLISKETAALSQWGV